MLARSLGVALALLLSSAAAHAAGPDYEEPDEDWVWQDGNDFEDGTTDDGFYRPRARPGYEWVEGHYENGAWVPADYRPVAPAPGLVWEPGFRGPDGYFVTGFWRPAERPGYAWVPATRGQGGYRSGYWRPLDVRPDAVWEDGYWTPTGVWIDGTWRERVRPGFVWVPGHWSWGRWIPGHWQPLRGRPGYAWVAGYWGPGGWIEGYWRPAARRGFWWRPGRWEPGGVWIAGDWVGGRRPARVHARPRPVRHMVVERRPHRNLWHDGRREDRHSRPARPRPAPRPQRPPRHP